MLEPSTSAADELMPPPLVTELVGGDEVGEVDVGGLEHAADEADAFGEGNGVGKGLGEGAVARKLEDAVLRELIGTEDALIVVESGARAGEHVVDVVGVRGIVVDLEGNVAVRPVVNLLPDLVAGGEVGEEVEDVRRAHAVFEKVAAVGLPFALQIAGRDGDLIGRGADDGVIGDPVGLARKNRLFTRVNGVAAVSHFFEQRKMLFAAATRIVDLDVGVVADVGKIARVEEGAVVGELRGLVAVAEATGLVAHVERQGDRFAGRQRLVERVDGVEVARRRAHQVERPVELDIRDRLLLIGDVDLRDRLLGLVLQREAAGAVEGAALGINVDGGVDRGDLGLGEVFVLS